MANPTRPFIGVNADFTAAGKSITAHLRLPIGYIDSIAAAGGTPVVIPPLAKEIDPDVFLDRLDGVLLTGGLDLDPRRHGLPTHPAVQLLPERRDESDRLLVQRIVERRLPVLGVGLGMQQFNVALGGTLFLHLPAEQPRAMPHRDAAGAPHRHIVLVEPNTRLEEIYGAGEIRVNSSHHQAVRQAAPDFRVCARAPDGVVEAIEAVDPNWFCVGVQWHPESETASALDAQLFECFVQACLRQAQTLPLAA
jgi:putative glutamine amidotransferase